MQHCDVQRASTNVGVKGRTLEKQASNFNALLNQTAKVVSQVQHKLLGALRGQVSHGCRHIRLRACHKLLQPDPTNLRKFHAASCSHVHAEEAQHVCPTSQMQQMPHLQH